MPGGSVNGRPFRESADSYQKTGIPCGNPRRFHSQDVVRMETGRRSAARAIDGPLEEIETEGQRHLRALAQQQTDANVTVQQQLSQKRQFSHGAEHRPATDDLSGMVTLSTYQTLEKTDMYIEEMKSYGLTEEEILLKLEAEDGSVVKRSKLSNPAYTEARLKEIDRKVAAKKEAMAKPDTFSNTKHISRHEMDLERALSSTNRQTSFLHGTLIKEQVKTSHFSDDPMNDLPEIVKSLTPGKYNVIHPLRKNKLPKHSYKSDCTLECCKPVSTHVCSECERSGKVDGQCSHDLPMATCMERPEGHTSVVSPNQDSTTSKETTQTKPTPTRSSSFVVHRKSCLRNAEGKIIGNNETKSEQFKSQDIGRDNQPNTSNNVGKCSNAEDTRVLDVDVQTIPEDAITRYRLTSEEVKKLPKFEIYTPGEPSNVLYVKNLSPKVTEADLASLFISFQEGHDFRIVFKLLTGRMKGQAFVTFPDTPTASAALELVHGYQFKGKPVIIQYGKKSN